MLAYLQTGWHYLWNILRPRHRLGWRGFVVLGVIALAVVLVTTPTVFSASWTEAVVGFISDIILWVATLFLKLSIFCLTFIIEVAGYNKYLDSTAVNYGWVMVRDLTNMIFVVILLLIAFGTILGIEQYEWKKMLVKFVAAAILVNFSRIICGVMIDVGQVVMITFINGVAATAGGNLINAFGANEIMSLAEGGADAAKVTPGEVFMAAVMAIVFAGMMLMTMLVYLVILVARMIQLWVLIVLSPLAFVFSVIPTTQKYASEWWTKFGSNVVSGPIIAFFLWLSFVTVGQGTVGDEVKAGSQVKKNVQGDESAGITKAMSWAKMANFAIAIGMLLVGAETAQKLGVTGGSMMSKVGDFGKKVATIASGVALGQWVGGKAKEGGKYLGKGILMNAPLIGGNSWKQYGKQISNKGLKVATAWNEKLMGGKEGGFIRKRLQFGRTKKIMGELERQEKVFEGSLGSSTNIGDYKDRTDRLEGQQELTKATSESKRKMNVLNRQKELLSQKEIEVERAVFFGKKKIKNPLLKDDKYINQQKATEQAQHGVDTNKIKLELDFLGKSGMGEDGKPRKGQAFIESRAELNAWTDAINADRAGRLSTVRTKRAGEARKDVASIEDKGKRAAELKSQITEKNEKLAMVKQKEEAISKLPDTDEKGKIELASEISKLRNEAAQIDDVKLKAEADAILSEIQKDYKQAAIVNPEVANAYSKMNQDENKIHEDLEVGRLGEQIKQNVWGVKNGFSMPKQSLKKAVAAMMHHMDGMDRGQMLGAAGSSMNIMNEKHTKRGESYKPGDHEYDEDYVRMVASYKKCKSEGFVDDGVGGPEQALVRSLEGKMGDINNNFGNDSRRDRPPLSASEVSGGDISKIATVLTNASHVDRESFRDMFGKLDSTYKGGIQQLISDLKANGGTGFNSVLNNWQSTANTAGIQQHSAYAEPQMLAFLKHISESSSQARELEEQLVNLIR